MKRIRAVFVATLLVASGCTQVKALESQVGTALTSANSTGVNVDSASISPPNCDNLAAEIPKPKMDPPVVNVSQFGAKGDGVTDDSDAINRAITSMKSGGTLVFEQGKTYLKTKNILVNQAGVHLWGYGSTITAQVPAPADLKGAPAAAQVSIQLSAPRTAAYGMTILSIPRLQVRTSHPNGAGIVLAAADVAAIDNRIEYASSGIFVRMASNFLVARNVVYRTAADGIHITSGSRDGRVLCNAVRETGDDMIAIVNYGLGEPNIYNFRIEANDVEGNFWGRGIAVIGGADVTIRGNRIGKTTVGAGIYIASDPFYKTANVRDVVVENNEILDTQMTAPMYNPRSDTKRTGQGAIEIVGQESQGIRNVLIRNNKIDRAFRDGIRVRGNSCDIGVENNAMTAIGGLPMTIQPYSPQGQCQVGCSGNTANGNTTQTNACSSQMPQVRGAKQ